MWGPVILIPNVKLKIYHLIDGELELKEPRQAYFIAQWKKLSEHEKKILLNELAKDN